jgi:hypothetical protein
MGIQFWNLDCRDKGFHDKRTGAWPNGGSHSSLPLRWERGVGIGKGGGGADPFRDFHDPAGPSTHLAATLPPSLFLWRTAESPALLRADLCIFI